MKYCIRYLWSGVVHEAFSEQYSTCIDIAEGLRALGYKDVEVWQGSTLKRKG